MISNRPSGWLGHSVGLVELVGFVPAIAAADAMLKAAYVSLGSPWLIGDGLVSVVVFGDVASTRVAVDAGVRMAQDMGATASGTVIGRPYPELLIWMAPRLGLAEDIERHEEDI